MSSTPSPARGSPPRRGSAAGSSTSSRPRPCVSGSSASCPGLLQTEEYARAILAVNPGVTEDQVSERLAARLARQAILARDDPPAAWFLVDEAALRRCVGSPEVMAAQLAHLGGVARLPNVTIQVVPSIAHAGLLGGFAVAERAAYVETAVAGQVFEDADIIAGLLTRFDTLRNEAFRGSESLALIERMCRDGQHLAQEQLLR